MYLPAIPLLQKNWQQPLTIINLTLVSFLISYCLFLLIYGSLSDRFGRRPTLLIGIGIYILASLACAMSDNVTSMIIFRITQAAGATPASVLDMAISKDVYEGHERGQILAYIGVIMALAPMLAPVIGGLIMIWLSWQWIFVVQGVIGVIAWIGVFRMQETLKTPSMATLPQTVGVYLKLLHNKRYIGFALMMSMVVLPHFAFIGGSAYIYISEFGLSEQCFSCFFAANAAAIMAGSFACTKLLGRVGAHVLLTASFIGIFLGGMGMVTHIFPGPWALALPMALASFSFGLSRPPSNNLVLEQVDRHAGAASSLLIFIYFMLGAFAMWLISLNWADKISVIGTLGIGCGGITLSLWLLTLKQLSRKELTP